jgi:hypothetical protein
VLRVDGTGKSRAATPPITARQLGNPLCCDNFGLHLGFRNNGLDIDKMQRYQVSCYDANECLADLTLEAPNKAVAEMMVLTQLQGTSTPLANRIDKLVVRPEGETAEAEPAFIDKELNETIGPNQPAHQPPAWGDEIKVYDPEKLAGLTPSSGARIRRAAIIASVLSSAGVAWIGWNSLHSAGEVPSAAPGDQKPASSAPSVGSEHPMPTQSASVGEAPQQSVQSLSMEDQNNSPVSASGDRHDSTQSTVQPVGRTETTAVVQQKNSSASSAVRNKPKPRPTPFPETKPTTIDGWVIREVANGRAVLQGPNGVWKVTRGGTVPGLGTVDSIVLWGNRWIVATSRGLITTQ